MAKGECNCGAVKFEISNKITDIYLCHCSICRRATASGAIAVVVVPIESFSWTSEQSNIQTWQKPDHDWATSFCKTCGSSLPGKDSDKNMYVPVGLLTDGAEDLKVAHHIWVGSKASWEVIGDNGKQHLEKFIP